MWKKIGFLGTMAFLAMACNPEKPPFHTEESPEVTIRKGEISEIQGTRKISGVYPHLTTYAHARINGEYGFGSECGIGGLAEWNGKLYMINYAAHQPKGSEHKLYIIDKDMHMEVYEGSIGGTPAARMVHQESNQLFLGPYVIDSVGHIRVIPYSRMEGRLTAYARHLKDPVNMVYMYDMEGMLYEVNVHTLEVHKLFQDPLPGWHGKGGYTSQGRLVVSNNGEHASEGRLTNDTQDWRNEEYVWEDNWKVDKEDIFGPENLGILAEFDGDHFKVVERRQYTDVTTKNGIYAVPNDDSPLWAIGWDRKSLRLKVLDHGQWHTYLLPKAAYNNDPPHGWFTEWPRIRSIGEGRMMMDMHGMFYDFPEGFSATNTSGIKPIGSHLRYIPDFVQWNGQVVLATDETSIQGNPLAGQPQSNLWFGSYEQLGEWGPASGYGAVWLKDNVAAQTPSDPYLMAGFDHRMVHLKNSGDRDVRVTLEIDKEGNNHWTPLETLALKSGEYLPYIFEEGLQAQWVRLISDAPSELTAAFHFTDGHLREAAEDGPLFEALADIGYDGKVSHAKLYSNKINFNLSVYPGEIAGGRFRPGEGMEFTKFDFEFMKGIKDTTSREALAAEEIGAKVGFHNEKLAGDAAAHTGSVWDEDAASIIINAADYRLRLPKGKTDYAEKLPPGTTRFRREVESERELANVGGTFYELPLFKVGEEPRYRMMRPVATHNRQISDFNTWNGLLVMSGLRSDAAPSEHVYTSEDGNVGLWFGGIDDLWSFGKPVGEGGPWKDTQVTADQASDLYLMTGYDKKSLHLEADKDTHLTLMLYVNHYLDEPVVYKTFSVKAGEPVDFEFPEGFSAHWAQLVSDTDCKATAWFVYE